MLEVLPLQVSLCQTGQVFSAFPRRVINDWEKTKVNILAMFPEIPVGGCFKYFLKELELITQDNRVLSVLKEGHKREFIQKQKF